MAIYKLNMSSGLHTAVLTCLRYSRVLTKPSTTPRVPLASPPGTSILDSSSTCARQTAHRQTLAPATALSDPDSGPYSKAVPTAKPALS